MKPNLWLADYDFLCRALAEYAEIKERKPSQQARKQKPADIVIDGLLLPTVPKVFDMDIREFGFRATGYDEIIEQVEAARASRSQVITMAVDSGGGSVEQIDHAIDALHKLAGEKTIRAHVDGMAASAAFWLTTIAHEITATRMSEVGGIGAYIALSTDADNNQMVIRSGEHKGAGLDGWTDAQVAAIQERVDYIAKQFYADVIATRTGLTLEDISSGRTWDASRAHAMNLIDAVTNNAGGVMSRATMETETMTIKELEAKVSALAAHVEALTAKAEETPPEEEEEEAKTKAMEDEEEEKAEDEEKEKEESKAEEDEEKKEEAKAINALSDKMDRMLSALANSGVAPIRTQGARPVAPRNWGEAVAYVAKRDKCRLSDAGAVALAEFPQLHPAVKRG